MRILLLIAFFPSCLFAQTPVVTAFPSLRISSSSRCLAMGDCGIASAEDNQQLCYNVARSAFIQNFQQASLSYTPWAAAIGGDMKFMSMGYLASVRNTSSLGIALNYLDLGMITTRDNNGASIAEYKAREYNLGFSYALQLNERHSLGVSLRLLGQNTFTDAPKYRLGVCGDMSYYGFAETNERGQLRWGAVLSNIGPKQDLQNGSPKTFLPTNIGIGFAYSQHDEGENQWTFAVDLNKLLVPSAEQSDKGILGGMFSSFGEPGQLQRIRVSVGAEYGFADAFFLRGGISLENRNFGNRKFLGIGAGYKGFVLDQSFGIDFHYLGPFGSAAPVSPFQNAFGFTLRVNFGNFQ